MSEAAQKSTDSHSVSPNVPVLEHATIAQLGDYWSFSYRSESFLLRDMKGLGYIKRLLENPNDEFYCLDLLVGSGVASETDLRPELAESLPIGGPGDAGEMLDTRAKDEYRRRLKELRQTLEEERDRGDHDRAARTEAEIGFLAREIARAVGLGGRDRRAGSAAERARLSVTRAIKTSLERVSEHHALLGEVLRRTIRTGNFCSYVPGSTHSVLWQFTADNGTTQREPVDTKPLLPARRTIFSESELEKTAFVGRIAERTRLRLRLARALAGERNVVMISGVAGVGKTRLANELRVEASRNGFVTLSGCCFERAHAAPFAPFVEMIEAIITQEADAEALRELLGNSAAHVALLIPQLHRKFPDIQPLPEISPQQSRPLLFSALAEVLTRFAAQRPILIVIDDLHWADDATLSLLAHIVRDVNRAHFIVVGTYRDNDWDPAGPLAALLEELTRTQALESVALGGLAERDVNLMLEGLSGQPPSKEIVSFFYSGTGGNPFFVEELFRHLSEGGQLLDEEGRFRRDLTKLRLSVPPTLQVVIGRRLARINELTRTILGVAAVIGRSFTFDVLEAAGEIAGDALIDRLEEAERSGLITATLAYPEAQFHFSHEMVRMAVLESLSAPRLQRLHSKVALAIVTIFPDALEDRVNDVAAHLWQAGSASDPAKTFSWLASAAGKALAQSAYDVTIENAQRALTVLRRLPASAERDASELALTLEYGVAIAVTKGWYAPEFGRTYARARELCERVGNSDARASVAFGLWSFYLVRGEHRSSRIYADELVELASQPGQESIEVQAHWASGATHFFMGELNEAHAAFERSAAAYVPAHEQALAVRFGQDPCMSALCYDAITLWLLGYPAKAEDRAQESLHLARALESPFSLVWCLSNLGKYYTMRRDYNLAERSLEEALELARAHQFFFYEIMALTYWGIAMAAQGRFEMLKESSRKMPRSLESDSTLSRSFMFSALAESFAQAGKSDRSLMLLERADAAVRDNSEKYVASEIARIRGAIRLRQAETETGEHQRNSLHEAIRLFREAVAIARTMGSKILELRAVTGYGETLQRLGKSREAQEALEEIYQWFTEGFDAPDLVAARRLLTELRASGSGAASRD